MRSLVKLAGGALILIAGAAATRAQPAQDRPANEVEVRAVYAIPSGDASFSRSGAAGSVVSFERDFDFGNEFGLALRYTRRSENDRHKFLAEYSSASWERGTTLSRSFTFLGETYQANLNAEADLKLRSFRAMYAYRWGNEKVRIGPAADVGVVVTRIGISGTTNNGARSGEGSFTKFTGTLGYDLDYEPTSKVSLYHSLGGMALLGDRIFRVEGGAKYFPVRRVGLSGGYRFQYVKLADDDDFLKIKLNGPFVGGVFRF